MNRLVGRSDVTVQVYGENKISVDFGYLQSDKINAIGRINGKQYDFREIGLAPAIEEFCRCVKVTIEHVKYARLRIGSKVTISTNVPEEVKYIADQIRSLLRLQGISVA